MNDKLKKVLAILVLIITIFGWFLTVKGIPGTMDPIASGIQKGLDIEGGVYVVLEAQDTESLTDEELRDLMDRTEAVITNRVDALGLSNPTVSTEAGNRIRVELPGVENADDAIAVIGKTAQLQFVLADGTFILDGGNVKNAALSTNSQSGGYCVELEFDAEGRDAFEDATAITANGGVTPTIYENGRLVDPQAIVILLDDEVISAPTAKKVITSDTCIIEGQFTQDYAANLAALIRGGSLPVELKEISSSSQTATIGLDAFEKSVMAGIIGLIIIFLLMLFFYRIMGIAADLSLALYVVILIAAMNLMGSVLTLPGIAGIILSIGMAVDANVIIFARIKEEIRSGKSVRVATKTGYKRAMSTVIDSQVTTLIATVILYQLGTSSVKGFAWTLMLGIIASIFTAVFVTQLFLGIFSESKALGTAKLFGVKESEIVSEHEETPLPKTKFKFVKNRKKYYCVSAAIIIIGLVVSLTAGFNYGIDFTGGTMIHIDTHTQASEDVIKNVATEQGINADQMQIVYSGEGNHEVIIKTNESLDNQDREKFITALEGEIGFEDADILESEFFGPSVGNELKKNAFISVILAAIGMLIYIRFRFKQWKFGSAALIGVIHDVLIVAAFYAIFRVTVNNPFIAAILTVVGYSINDTIVIFDRIRENLKFRRGGLDEIIDLSINQTLSRSIMTSVTTLIVMIPLLIMTGDAIREFILPLMIGVLAGCMSSIFICSPLYYELESRAKKSAYEKQIAASKKKKNKYVKKEAAPKAEKPAKVEKPVVEEAAVAAEGTQEAVAEKAPAPKKAPQKKKSNSKKKSKKK